MANNFDPYGRQRRARAHQGENSILTTWGFYVCLGEMIAGFVMLLIATALVDPTSRWNGVGISIMSMVMGLVGIIGLIYRADHWVAVHMIGVLMCLSMLFSLRWQVSRTVSVDCALAELGLINFNLMEMMGKERGRKELVFNTMMMRLTAMDMTLDKLHDNPDMFKLPNTAVTKRDAHGQGVETTYYKQVWRVADNYFVSQQLEGLKKRATQLLDTLQRKVNKRIKAVEDDLPEDIVKKLKDAVEASIERVDKAARRCHEHLAMRLPEDEMSAIEYEKLVQEVNTSMTSIMELLIQVEREIGKDSAPLRSATFKRWTGLKKGDVLKGHTEVMKDVQDALFRRWSDVYDTMNIGDLGSVREAWRKKWEATLISEINHTALEQRSYMEKYPKRCLTEIDQQYALKNVGLLLIWLQSISVYLMLSLSFKLAAASQTS